jgi:hypothetical protein
LHIPFEWKEEQTGGGGAASKQASKQASTMRNNSQQPPSGYGGQQQQAAPQTTGYSGAPQASSPYLQTTPIPASGATGTGMNFFVSCKQANWVLRVLRALVDDAHTQSMMTNS